VLHVQRVNGRSVVIRALAESPLRLLTPRGSCRESAAVFTSTFGGGLVAGDIIDLSVSVGPGAHCTLTTQASTKIYRSQTGEPATQSLHLDVASNATCVVLPDPLTCFAGAAFEQRMRIDLAESASLVLVDWLTSGRRARGERWAFASYSSRIDARVASKLIFRDAVRLDQADGPIADEHRMGSCDCFGVVLLLGARAAVGCADMLAWANAQPVHHDQKIVFTASPIPGGAVIRVAGSETEAVGRWIRRRLASVADVLGADPWSRKW
jgi:urease accessory protein